jgi:hypothetical protein
MNKMVKLYNLIRIIPGKIVLSVPLLILFLNSCHSNKQDILCSPLPAYRIEIINSDSVGIVGIGKQYHPDSIFYEIGDNLFKANTSSDCIYLDFTTAGLINNRLFYLHLNSKDQDTMKLIFQNGINECGDTYTTILEFYYNQKLIPEKSRVFKIVK